MTKARPNNQKNPKPYRNKGNQNKSVEQGEAFIGVINHGQKEKIFEYLIIIKI